jgi:hypothetical protein
VSGRVPGRLLLAAVLSLTCVGAAAAAEPRFLPASGTTWQWQLTTPVDLSVPAEVYDIDGFDNSAVVVARLHRVGRHAICYLDVGAYEAYRPDARRFPAAVLGKADIPWQGERWLDVRRLDVLLPIMRERIAMCARKRFDAVELDEVDGFSNDTGFPLTAADQLAYNRALAREVHRRGLSVALKNDVEQIPQLLGSFDFSIDEQCATYDECGTLLAFVRRDSAVFHVEYALRRARFCSRTAALGLSSMRKRLELGRYRELCAPAPGARVPSATAAGGRVVAVVACPPAHACATRIELRAGGDVVARRALHLAPGARAEVAMSLPGRLAPAVRARSGAVVVVACRSIGRGCAVTGRASVAPGA